ncbi:hypothetical protein NC653_039194 [Populus alba x Populus x berolinensis]|uniref:Uncharacterized protein n=1 Tax=Populus alba x Populus x berolinensis TaxID=444605 RepID=A0AAD6LD86_9ROSI|nr:hypothetical protein NC653_039194 [Populus alba x Populus x berolinensis]
MHTAEVEHLGIYRDWNMSFSETSKQIKEGLAFFALMKYRLLTTGTVLVASSNRAPRDLNQETEGGKLRTTVSAEGNVGSGGASSRIVTC